MIHITTLSKTQNKRRGCLFYSILFLLLCSLVRYKFRDLNFIRNFFLHRKHGFRRANKSNAAVYKSIFLSTFYIQKKKDSLNTEDDLKESRNVCKYNKLH